MKVGPRSAAVAPDGVPTASTVAAARRGLAHDEVLDLYGALATRAGDAQRSAMMSALPPELVAQLPQVRDGRAQLLSDLARLREIDVLVDGTSPLASALEALRGARASPAPTHAPPDGPADGAVSPLARCLSRVRAARDLRLLVPNFQYLTRDELQAVHARWERAAAAVPRAADLRRELMTGVHPQFEATLRRHAVPSAQIWLDLEALNRTQRLTDGSCPLERVLANLLAHERSPSAPRERSPKLGRAGTPSSTDAVRAAVDRAEEALSARGRLDHDTILGLIDVVIDVLAARDLLISDDYAAGRDLLLAGLPPAYTASLPLEDSPLAQALSDLATLNGDVLIDGTRPLAVLLANLRALA